jgi:hypothetical protein
VHRGNKNGKNWKAIAIGRPPDGHGSPLVDKDKINIQVNIQNEMALESKSNEYKLRKGTRNRTNRSCKREMHRIADAMLKSGPKQICGRIQYLRGLHDRRLH